MKSSTMRSKSILKGGFGILNSCSKYSRRVQIFKNCKGTKSSSNTKQKSHLENTNSNTASLPGMASLEQQVHLSHHIPQLFFLPFLHSQRQDVPPDHIRNICPAAQEYKLPANTRQHCDNSYREQKLNLVNLKEENQTSCLVARK